MRTTIDLPDNLMTEAKIAAAQRGVTLKDLFIEALATELGTTTRRPGGRMRLPLVRSSRPDDAVELTADDIDEALTTVDVEKYAE